MLYAGKLSFSKGVDVLLRSVQSISEGGVHLHLAGSGTGEEKNNTAWNWQQKRVL